MSSAPARSPEVSGAQVIPLRPSGVFKPGSTPLLSIVIPAYNEEKRLGRTLTETLAYLAFQQFETEIIVVDDGSKDRTADIANEFAALSKGRLRVLRNPGNRGKGYSVRHGVLSAKGEYVLFFDADLSTPLSEIPKVLAPLKANNTDVIVGSRASAQRETQTMLRQFIGKQFKFLRKTILGLGINDTQCGFKAFRREAALSVFSYQTVNGFAFDVEILMIAQRQKWRVQEQVVEWQHQEGSTVHPLFTSMNMLKDLIRIRVSVSKRRFERLVTHASVRVVSRDGAVQDCMLADLSRGGAFVCTANLPFTIGTELTMTLPLPDGTLLDLPGRVVHTGRKTQDGQGFGVQFTNMPEADVAKLESFLARL